MKKKLPMLLILVAIFSLNIFANPVNVKIAKQVGLSFLTTSAAIPNGELRASTINYELIYTANVHPANPALRNSAPETETALFYVFGAENNGYVIVAGDDCVIPILGYANKGTFDAGNIPPNMQEWLKGYEDEIRYAIENNVSVTEEIFAEWQSLQMGTRSGLPINPQAVAPLLSTAWDQFAPYNNLCPMYSSSNRSITGCVATVMAQIMKYHQYPAQGTGQSEPYTTRNLGIKIPSVNFAVNYDWDHMLDSYSSYANTQQQNAVATLMYHCGVSVEMNYAASSGAYSSSVPPALTTYFGYDKSIKLRKRVNFNNESWENTLKEQINAGLPVFYSGASTTSGHAFICDGYDSNNYFHFNWGWSGLYDGYFATTALQPRSGADAGYNHDHTIIIDIKPDKGGLPNYEMALSYEFSISTTAVLPNGTFTSSIGLRNIGEAAFPGGYIGVALVDENEDMVEIVGSTLAKSLSSNNYYSNSFHINCNLSGNVSLGLYKLRAAVSIDGQEWKIIPIAADCYNSIDFQVVEQFVSATEINLNISNTSLIVGESKQLTAAIVPYNTSNRNIIWQSSDPKIVSVNYDGKITALSGGTAFITVKTQDGNHTDICFVTVTNAYEMSLRLFTVSKTAAYPNDALEVSINLANVGQSVFPGGYLGIAIVDNNGQMNVIGEVAKGSLSPGYIWSTATTVDCIIPGDIARGEYKLKVVCRTPEEDWNIINLAKGYPDNIDFQILRTSGISDNINENFKITIYPNPAKDFVIIDFPENITKINKIILCDMQGRQIYSENATDFTKSIHLPLNNVLNGIYFVQIYSERGVLMEKLIVKK